VAITELDSDLINDIGCEPSGRYAAPRFSPPYAGHSIVRWEQAGSHVTRMEVSQMGEASSIVGFIIIVILYIVIGIMAAAGSIFVSQRIFTPKADQIFYGIFLIPIAGFYLAFTAYFGSETAWLLESTAVLAFVAMSLIGIRVPFAIIVGYPLHGLWDLLHEFHAHGGYSVFAPGQATAVPLAYGIFCATYDLCMGLYFFTRRSDWAAAWKTKV